MNTYSFSKRNAYRQCPAQYRYRYLEKLPREPSQRALMGSELHDIIARYQEAIGDRGGRALDTMTAVATQVFWEPREDGQTLPAEALEELTGDALRYAENHWVEPEQLVASEWWFEVPLGHFVFNGRVDLVEMVKDNHFCITDYTRGRGANKERQLREYAVAVFAEWPQATQCTLRQDILVYDNPDYAVTEWLISYEESKAVRAEIVAEVKGIEGATVWPHQPGEHCAYCAYHAYCIKDFPPAEGYQVADEESARETGRALLRHKAIITPGEQGLRGWVKESGPLANGDGKVWALWPRLSYKWNVAGVVALAQEQGWNPTEYLTISSDAARKLLRDHPDCEGYADVKTENTFALRKP